MADYENFVFYGRWRNLIEGFDQETAKEILWQIMLMGTSGEITTDNPMIRAIITGAIECNMTKAKNRYAAALKSKGRVQQYSSDEIKSLNIKGVTNQEIANALGCSLRTVQRALQEDNFEDL